MDKDKPKYVVAQKKKTTASKKLVQGNEANTSSLATNVSFILLIKYVFFISTIFLR